MANVPFILTGAGTGFLVGGPVGALAGGVAAALVSGGSTPTDTPVVGVSADQQVGVASDGSLVVPPTVAERLQQTAANPGGFAPRVMPVTSPYPRPLQVAPLTDAEIFPQLQRGGGSTYVPGVGNVYYPSAGKVVLGVGPGQAPGTMQLAGFDFSQWTGGDWLVLAGVVGVGIYYRKNIVRLLKGRRW